MKCTSCGTDVRARENFVVFPCPKCGEAMIVRCERCKAIGRKYVCPKCGFVGP